jgi:hypothetical protein
MQPVSAAGTAASVANAQAQGKALQNQYNQQATTYGNQYNQQVGQANQYGANLENYAQNYGQNYMQNLNNIGSQLGYNPGTTQQAANNLTTAENIQSALPQSAQQMGNYGGATAGQIAQNYQNMAGNMSGYLGNANNALQNQLGLYTQMQTGANNIGQGTTAALGQAYSTATQQMQTAAQQMQAIEQLQQQQGTVTAGQVAQYQNAYGQYVQASAAAQASVAAANQSNAQAQLFQQQYSQQQAIQQAYQQIYGNNWAAALNGNAAKIPTLASQTSSPALSIGSSAGTGNLFGAGIQ